MIHFHLEETRTARDVTGIRASDSDRAMLTSVLA
jgi:hypothetical protein